MSRRSRLGLLDLPWALLETRQRPMHVAGLIVCRRPRNAQPDFIDDLVARMRAADEVVDPFDRVLDRRGTGLAWPRWSRAGAIDLDRHVFRADLPQPGGDHELERLVSMLHGIRLDRTRPLWQLHVIDGLDRGRFALYAKFHHSLVDGVGAIRILQSVFATAATPDVMPIWGRRPAATRTPTPTPRATARRHGAGFARGAVAAVTHAVRRSTDRPWAAPRSVLNTSIDETRAVLTMSFELDRFRALADAMHGSINDAFLTVCAAALRRFLLDHEALPTRSLTAIVPVSIRPADGSDVGNAMTFAFVPLSSDIDDPRERSAGVTAGVRSAKARLAALPKYAVNAYTVVTMAPFIIGQLVGVGARTTPMFNVALSNVAGPDRTLYYGPAEVEAIFAASILQSGQALNVTAMSYAGRFDVTLTACPTDLPPLGDLPGRFEAALTELGAAYAVPSSDTRRKA